MFRILESFLFVASKSSFHLLLSSMDTLRGFYGIVDFCGTEGWKVFSGVSNPTNFRKVSARELFMKVSFLDSTLKIIRHNYATSLQL
jgi:hypothetical protein